MGHVPPGPTALSLETMTRFQIGIVALCIAIAGLDGFDVLVVAFTAPAIAKDWSLNRKRLFSRTLL